MAEQEEPNTSQTSSSISDTISELLQNPAQVDIATTLGLLDDTSNLVAGSGGLDTSAMLDPSTFLQPPSTVVSGTQTVGANPSNTQKSFTNSPSSLEAISNRLLQGISSSSVSSEKEESISSTQNLQQLASKSTGVDASPKVATAPFPTSDTVADLTSLINSIVSQEQQAGGNIVATALTSSTPLQPQSTASPSSSSIPIPSATHIPHSASTPAQGLTEQKGSQSKQKESVMQVSMAIPSLGDLCKSLGVNINKEAPPLQAPKPATSLSLSTGTTASLPSNAAVGKTEREPNATVMDQSTAAKLDSGVSTVQVMASSEHKTVMADAILQQKQAPISTAVQHEHKPSTEALSVSSSESVSSLSGLSEAKKQKSADSAGKPAAIPSSFLAAIQLQPSSSQKSLAQAGSSQLQTSAANLPQILTPSPSSVVASSLPSSALPGNLTGSAIGKGIPLQTANVSSSVKASISQPQGTQKAIPSSFTSQKLSGGDTALKVVSAAKTTPAVVVQATTTKSSAATKTLTPPTGTPTTGAKSQQTGGSNIQMDSSATTTPKDLNLPILQFLQANFPALQLGALTGSATGEGRGGGGEGDSSKEVLQVQTLLAHVLQQQQQLQQLQQQAQQQVQKAIASGQSLSGGGSPSPSSTSTVAPKSSLSAVKQTSTATRQKRSTTPVFAQILPQATSGVGATKVTISQGVVGRPTPVVIPKQPKNGAAVSGGGFTSPLLLSRQKKTKVSSTLVSVPTATGVTVAMASSPLTSVQVGTMTTPQSVGKREGGGTRMSTRTAAKQHHLTKTLVEPVDAEPMDLDVGEPFQILELPPHLKDHSYSCYNPEEGERIAGQQVMNIKVFSGIPPARVSYAPPLPDSPNTLYKLLKVIPKKTASRRSSAARTPSKRSRRYIPIIIKYLE